LEKLLSSSYVVLLSQEPEDLEEDGDRPLLTERQQEPLCNAMEHVLTRKGVKELHVALKKGAMLNSPYTDQQGADRLVSELPSSHPTSQSYSPTLRASLYPKKVCSSFCHCFLNAHIDLARVIDA